MREQLLKFRACHQSTTLRVTPQTWTYLASGTGAQCVLLLPGGMGSGEFWFEYISALEDSCRVIAPDIPVSTRSLAEVIAGLAAILDAESIAHAHLFGHSQGGMIAQAFVRAFPERTASVTLSNTSLPSEAHTRKIERRHFWLRFLPEAVLRFTVKRSLARRLATDAPDLSSESRAFWLDYMTETTAGNSLRAAAMASARIQLDYHRNATIGDADLVGWPGRVLIFDSQGDTLVTQDEFAQLRAAYPGAICHTFQGTGHLDVITRVESYLMRTRLFWGGAAAVRGPAAVSPSERGSR